MSWVRLTKVCKGLEERMVEHSKMQHASMMSSPWMTAERRTAGPRELDKIDKVCKGLEMGQ